MRRLSMIFNENIFIDLYSKIPRKWNRLSTQDSLHELWGLNRNVFGSSLGKVRSYELLIDDNKIRIYFDLERDRTLFLLSSSGQLVGLTIED